MFHRDNIFKKANKGFTLIEMLLAIAILAVLSGAVLVSVTAQRNKARGTRMLSELSGAIQPIYMCVADGLTVITPNSTSGGTGICNSSAYGQWPVIITGFGAYAASANLNSNDWYISLVGNGVKVCCNSHMMGCKIIGSSSTCNTTTP